MKSIKEQTDKELINLVNGLFDSLYITECFGTKDMLLYEAGCRELEKRGYQVNETKKLSIEKGGEK